MPDPKFPDEEPPASMRTLAKGLRDMFVALVKEGFTETQALSIIGQVIAAQNKKGDD